MAKGGTTKCPCAICRNYCRHKRDDEELHLCKYWYKDNYEIWTTHGESLVGRHDEIVASINHVGLDEIDQTDNVLVDLGGDHPPTIDDEPTASA